MKEKNTSPAISTNKEGATEVRNASTDMTWRATAEEEKGMKPERDPTERRIGKGTTEKEAERDVTAEGVEREEHHHRVEEKGGEQTEIEAQAEIGELSLI